MRSTLSRRGLSEIIAALMVVCITISATALFAIYASGLMGSILKPVTQPYTEQLTLDYYCWVTGTSTSNTYCSTTGNLVITVRNNGAATVNLVGYAYVQGAKLTLTTSNLGSNCGTSSLTGVLTALTVQSTCTITLPTTAVGSTYSSGVAYIVKLVANDGTIFTFSCIGGSYT